MSVPFYLNINKLLNYECPLLFLEICVENTTGDEG